MSRSSQPSVLSGLLVLAALFAFVFAVYLAVRADWPAAAFFMALSVSLEQGALRRSLERRPPSE